MAVHFKGVTKFKNFKLSGRSITGSQPGETSAYIIDGYGLNLAPDYSAGKYSFGTSYRIYGLEINVDTGSVDMTGDVNAGAIKGRMVIGTTQTNLGASAIVGTLDITAGKNLVSSQNGMCGVVDFYGNTTISGSDSHVSALTGVVWNEGTTTLNASAVSSVSGLDLVQNSGSPTTTSGINPAIYIRGTAWQYGIYMKASSATTGISINTCTTGINIEGTVTLALGIGSTTALTTATTGTNAVKVQSNFSGTAGTSHLANFFTSIYTGTSSGTIRSVVGQVDMTGVQPSDLNAVQYLVGVHGRAKVTGTARNSSLFVTGVHGQILDGGTWTNADHVSAIWGDWQLNKTLTGISSTELLYLSNNANNATNNPTNVMYIWAPYVTYFFSLQSATNGGMVSANTAAATTLTFTNWVTIKVNIDGTAHYIPAARTIAATG